MRRTSVEKSMFGHSHDVVSTEYRVPSNDHTEDILLEEEEDELLDETPFSLPIYAKPLPLLGHPSRHSVLNR